MRLRLPRPSSGSQPCVRILQPCSTSAWLHRVLAMALSCELPCGHSHSCHISFLDIWMVLFHWSLCPISNRMGVIKRCANAYGVKLPMSPNSLADYFVLGFYSSKSLSVQGRKHHLERDTKPESMLLLWGDIQFSMRSSPIIGQCKSPALLTLNLLLPSAFHLICWKSNSSSCQRFSWLMWLSCNRKCWTCPMLAG